MDGRFGPHDEVPAGWEMVQTELHEIPYWFPHYAVYEGGTLREMTTAEKTAADTQRGTEQKTQEFNANRALHAVFTVFLEEINSLRQAGGLTPLDANQVKNRIKQEYIAT